MPPKKNQVETWTEMQGYLHDVHDKVSALPAPPRPNDAWSDKVNQLNRAVEGMTESLQSNIENERLQEELSA